jgi:hypothetical protein
MAAKIALIWTIVGFMAATAAAQGVANEPRAVVFADVGYARMWDDEGLLGSGASLSGGGGFKVTRRVTIQALVDRVGYHRDVEWLTFDGRVLFAGVEAAFQLTRPRVRPFVTVGIGVFDDRGTWIRKTMVAPFQTVVEPPIIRDYTLSASTASGGIDFRLTDHASIRASVRIHGLLARGDDLAPHTIIRPGIGAAWSW